MSTQQVNYTVPSDGWTGSIDVTDANLLTDNTINDFVTLYNGVSQDSTENALWSKSLLGATLTYAGSSLDEDDVVWVRRKTPNEVVQEVSANSIILSALWNQEFDRQIRWREEYDLFSAGYATAPEGSISDAVYGAAWDGDVLNAPTKNAIYDGVELRLIEEIDNISPKSFNGRLSVDSSDPYGTGTSSTLYLHPVEGNIVWLYDTTDTRWEPHAFNSAVNIALTGLTQYLPYDVFLYDSSGTLTLELVAWTDRDTRASALTKQNSIYCKTGSLDRRFVGVIVPTDTNEIKVDVSPDREANINDLEVLFCSISNYYNKIRYVLIKSSNDNDIGVDSSGSNLRLNGGGTDYASTKYGIADLGLPREVIKGTYELSLDLNDTASRTTNLQVFDNNWAADTGATLVPFSSSAITEKWLIMTGDATNYVGHGSLTVPFGNTSRGFHKLSAGGDRTAIQILRNLITQVDFEF